MKSIFTKEQIDYMISNYKLKSYKEIADELGFTERQIRGRLNNMGLTKLRQFNSDYFHSIDSHNKAYWLGFIYADGYVVNRPEQRSYELGIELKSTDVDLLNDFNEELGSVHEVTFKTSTKNFNGYNYTTESCLIRVHSKEIVQDLISHNVLPNKTNKSEYPLCNDEFFFDFVRGFNDGDGCIYVDNRNHMRVNFTNANVDFLDYLSKQIYDKLGILGSIYKESEKKYRLNYYRKEDVKILLDKIYEDTQNEYLSRKYEIYKTYYGSAV